MSRRPAEVRLASGEVRHGVCHGGYLVRTLWPTPELAWDRWEYLDPDPISGDEDPGTPGPATATVPDWGLSWEVRADRHQVRSGHEAPETDEDELVQTLSMPPPEV